MEDIRLDKYLWAVRVFKTRSDAADAIRTNKVTVNGAYAKPSREVKIGDLIAVRKQQVTYSYKVLDLVSSRQPAKNVPLYCLDVTPQEERDKLNIPRETVFVFRERGTGRPTKKERRELDTLMDRCLARYDHERPSFREILAERKEKRYRIFEGADPAKVREYVEAVEKEVASASQ